MDDETENLCRLLAYQDNLRERLRLNERNVRDALDAWHASRPGNGRGKATEAGARFVLRQAGLL